MLGMIDRLEPSIARPAVSDPEIASPPVALEYQPPQRRGPRSNDMVWGVIISVLIANGVGWLLFGALMMTGARDDNAGPIAVGAAFIVLGAGVAASLMWTRRQQPRTPC
jgi:hypothetical protein